jgi:hypothetical protein
MNFLQIPSCKLLLSALDPGSLAALWAGVSLAGLLASLGVWTVLGHC